MKTALFTTSFLDGIDFLGFSRLERTKKYLEYYRKLKDTLGFTEFWQADNHSDLEKLKEIGATVYNEQMEVIIPGAPDLHIMRYDTPLYRGVGHDYPYAWRGIYFISKLIDMGYEKIITCDTDAYILSKKLADFIRQQDSGYVTMWSHKYNFPEAAITVLCKDHMPAFQEWCKTPWEQRSDGTTLFEGALPFTGFANQFVGDRYGEMNYLGVCQGAQAEDGWPQSPDQDWYSQSRTSTKFVYNMEGL
jgi:hypothetical protein